MNDASSNERPADRPTPDGCTGPRPRPETLAVLRQFARCVPMPLPSAGTDGASHMSLFFPN